MVTDGLHQNIFNINTMKIFCVIVCDIYLKMTEVDMFELAQESRERNDFYL